ncbi:MAG: hypothetical protein AAGF36_06570 [Pseudomonadota bacterium]
MEFGFTGVVRRLWMCAVVLALVVTSAAGSAAENAGGGATQVALSSQPIVVRNDRGGLLRARLYELQDLRRAGRAVEIRGAVCLSTCTLYLGLDDVCVAPGTTFGFHGPSSYGRALDPATFNRASEIIADHYPAALRDWYMETGRFKIRTMYRIKGAQLIRLGVRAC